MQVGDLVVWRAHKKPYRLLGLVVETGKYTGNGDVKVLWNRGVDSDEPHVHNSKFLKLVTSS